ncbi:uncharacterized protein LOC112089095 [Eutrema salsugineum]|uniref:uncharacterized protein LOC112089095 n=1 Tax=Eutrema salsugineum TaxID=72664 RepID=UPI000CED38BF|nr:uncharacterized protein LOC112089095 [Eutrema salsugineum]
MPGINPDITCHELNIHPTYKPIKQKRRKLGPEKARAVNDEVEKLLKAGSITEVRYPDWLANPVVVKKKNGKWRICVDFTDLNKACPKDSFPLPHIDRLVEATTGNELLSFMDAFSGYNQILMHPDDREKTSFITDRGIYCYKVMPFGLKNAGATYQRLVNRMFASQLGKTMEVYIDDMLVKSLHAKDHISHLSTCFDILNEYGMKLNPAKCTFGVTAGEFLGYIVTERGIEANPKQISAVLDLPSPTSKREVQKLTGRIAALNRFISRSTDKCLPFYQLLRAKPKHGETLFLYIAISTSVVSSVLVREDRGEQRPIFYVSKSLSDAEARYPALEKLALAMVVSAQKLRPYFQTHSITVLTDQPLRTILHSPSQSGRLAKWAVELSEYDIEYKNRTSAKSQVLADFLIELPKEFVVEQPPRELWILHVDESSSHWGSGVGIRLKSPNGEILEQSFRLEFPASNNESEYGVRLAVELGVRHLHSFCDSQLVASQLSGEYTTKNERMDAYLTATKVLIAKFETFELTKISRGEISSADALAALTSSSDPHMKRRIPVESISEPSIQTALKCNVATRRRNCDENPTSASTQNRKSTRTNKNAEQELKENAEHNPEDLAADHDFEHITEGLHSPSTSESQESESAEDWTAELREYLLNGKVPEDKWAARCLKVWAAHYTMHKDKLFRWSASGVLLTCVSGNETIEIMREIHEGSGGNHSRGRSLALKIKKTSYFWPTMNADCEKFVRKCDKCQRHGPMINVPTELLQTSTAPYPFMRWAMDIVDPLCRSTNQKQYVLIMTDYFTKWVEAEAYSEITALDGVQFIAGTFNEWCAKFKIRLSFSTPRYPQGNGQAEATNKTILDGIKKRLDAKKGTWADELDGVLWSHRTTPRRSTGQSPFYLAYGLKALCPAEVSIPTLGYSVLPEDPDFNDQMMLNNLDNLEEQRCLALLRIQNYQNLAARYYNKKIRGRHFDEGDLVLRKVFQNTEELNAGKLGTNWEGPYQIMRIVKPRVYELMQLDGTPIPRSWNSANLKRYYY